MRKLLIITAILLAPSLAFADRLGSLRSNADVLLTTQAVAGSGDITGVIAGVGLSSGGLSGTVTLDLRPDATMYAQMRGTIQTLQAGSTSQVYLTSGTVGQFYSSTVNGLSRFRSPGETDLFILPVGLADGWDFQLGSETFELATNGILFNALDTGAGIDFSAQDDITFDGRFGGVRIKRSGTTGKASPLRFEDNSGSKFVAFLSSPSVGTSYQLVWPGDVGVVGQAPVIQSLTADATAFMNWITPGSGGSDNLGSHIATKTLTVGFGITGTTATFTDRLTIPNSTAPVVNSLGDVAIDTNAWASGHGTMVIYEGGTQAFVVATATADTPTNGEVPRWNTGGLIDWAPVSTSSPAAHPAIQARDSDATDGDINWQIRVEASTPTSGGEYVDWWIDQQINGNLTTVVTSYASTGGIPLIEIGPLVTVAGSSVCTQNGVNCPTSGGSGVTGSTSSITMVFDGGGSAINPAVDAATTCVTVPYAATISSWTFIVPTPSASGSIAVTISKASPTNYLTSTFSNMSSGGNAPSILSSIYRSGTPSGWASTSISQGDIVCGDVTSATTVQRASLTMWVIR